jgi:hypothetical protein
LYLDPPGSIQGSEKQLPNLTVKLIKVHEKKEKKRRKVPLGPVAFGTPF